MCELQLCTVYCPVYGAQWCAAQSSLHHTESLHNKTCPSLYLNSISLRHIKWKFHLQALCFRQTHQSTEWIPTLWENVQNKWLKSVKQTHFILPFLCSGEHFRWSARRFSSAVDEEIFLASCSQHLYSTPSLSVGLISEERGMQIIQGPYPEMYLYLCFLHNELWMLSCSGCPCWLTLQFVYLEVILLTCET